MAAIAVVLAACPAPAELPGSSPSPGGPTPTLAAPGSGSPIRFGVLGEPATLDPYSDVASENTWTIARAIYPSLFRLLPDGTTRPDLAAGLEVRDGGAVVSVDRGATWSDGSPLTARDVVATWRRARRAPAPSGFRDIDGARAPDPTTVVLAGRVDDWEETLARITYILPRGRHGGVTGGPFRITRRTPGLEVVLEPSPYWFGEPRATQRIRVQFIRTTGTMLGLLEAGRLEAAAVPWAVNLRQRARAAGLVAEAALGWETIRLRFGPGLTRAERAGFVDALDPRAFEERLVRGDGRLATTLHPSPEGAAGPYGSIRGGAPPEGEITVTSPAGDGSLTLLLRGIYAQLDAAGVLAEASPIDPFIFYGEWVSDDPSDVSLRRAGGAPGLDDPPDDASRLDHFPLFHVASYLVSVKGLEGLEVNPTFDGPLWNAHEW